ncbi:MULTISPECIES: hypothetical protein [unclassified Acinetobacter]|uniref:hypothetical protein n=1 Tax=unclassified Acinetobacter TaxID=196816 RepID=UPI0015D3CCD4|nr:MULTISPECIES: hypothetical protein [unclassified Acinetobacter]
MTVMVSNQQNLQPINSAQLVGVFKAIAPRSFEKTFDGMPAEAINNAMKICIEGLSRDEINTGLRLVRDNGFCPDPAMFRKWCLGIVGFGTEQQRATDSFKGKHAALANVIRWIEKRETVITNAEKEAYDRCYEMFSNLNWSNNYERAAYLAYEAFKDNYRDVVSEFVEQGITQCEWEKPKTLKRKNEVTEDYGDWGDTKHKKGRALSSEEAQAQTKEYLEKLRSLIKRPSGGMQGDAA